MLMWRMVMKKWRRGWMWVVVEGLVDGFGMWMMMRDGVMVILTAVMVKKKKKKMKKMMMMIGFGEVRAIGQLLLILILMGLMKRMVMILMTCYCGISTMMLMLMVESTFSNMSTVQRKLLRRKIGLWAVISSFSDSCPKRLKKKIAAIHERTDSHGIDGYRGFYGG
jgi:hypothetical protein